MPKKKSTKKTARTRNSVSETQSPEKARETDPTLTDTEDASLSSGSHTSTTPKAKNSDSLNKELDDDVEAHNQSLVDRYRVDSPASTLTDRTDSPASALSDRTDSPFSTPGSFSDSTLQSSSDDDGSLASFDVDQILRQDLKMPATPPRQRQTKTKTKLMDSPHRHATQADADLPKSIYNSSSFHKQLTTCQEAFRSFVNGLMHTNRIGVTDNTSADPWQRISLNSHSNFCDRNPSYGGMSLEDLARTVQCCSIATRNENMTTIFLNHGNRGRVGIFPRAPQEQSSANAFDIHSLPEKVDHLSQVFMNAYTSLEISKIHVQSPDKITTEKRRSLIVNVGLITVYDEMDRKRKKTVAIVTGNGQFQDRPREFDAHLSHIAERIREERGDIETFVVNHQMTPIANKTRQLMHCEALCARLLGVLSDKRYCRPVLDGMKENSKVQAERAAKIVNQMHNKSVLGDQENQDPNQLNQSNRSPNVKGTYAEVLRDLGKKKKK